jgi:hypothetical protein
MSVNWQNLVNKIQNGQAAFDGANFGNPIDYSNLSFYDHPMSDLGSAAAERDRIRPNDFVIGTSKWGGSDLVTD